MKSFKFKGKLLELPCSCGSSLTYKTVVKAKVFDSNKIVIIAKELYLYIATGADFTIAN